MSVARIIAGVDSCKAGWAVAIAPFDDPSSLRIEIAATFGEVLALAGPESMIAVDIPIGVLDVFERGGRECDRQSRAVLVGSRKSCVFPTPIRPALEAPTYQAACEASRASASGAGALPIQSYGLGPEIREVDALLRAVPELRERVIETHPEIAFATLSGEPLPPKKSVEGQARRVEALATRGLADPTALLPNAASRYQPDDLIDAAVCLLVARDFAAGVAVSIPDPPPLDRFGIPMRILSPR